MCIIVELYNKEYRVDNVLTRAVDYHRNRTLSQRESERYFFILSTDFDPLRC